MAENQYRQRVRRGGAERLNTCSTTEREERDANSHVRDVPLRIPAIAT
jgi:hypothetical protein